MNLRRIGLGAAALLALVAQSALASSSSPFTATRALPPAAGEQTQNDAEPGMAVAPDGAIWVASNLSGSFTSGDRALGSDVYVSHDGGKTFRWVAQPISLTSSTPGAGGFDTDLTVAPEKNAKGHYTVYAASLSIAASTLAWSDDDGATWLQTPIAGTTLAVRQVSLGSKTMAIWPATVAIDAAGTVYFVWTDSVHSYLNTSRDGGATWSPSRRLDVGPIRAAVYPTVAALGSGRVDVAMYATDRAGNANDAARS